MTSSQYKEQFGEGTLQSKEFQINRLSTMKEKYGALVSPKARQKTRERADNLNKKGRETIFRKYGVINAGQMPNHGEKIRDMFLSKHGVDHYTKTEKYKEEKDTSRIKKYELFSPPTVIINSINEDPEKKLLFENPNKIVNFTCSVCNSTESIPTETYKWRLKETGVPCIRCSGINKGSLKEQAIKDFLGNNKISIIENKKMLDGLEIDIFLPDFNIGIEFNGLFWHNDTRIDKNYHLNKTVLAKEKGIRLIHIFEDEWDFKSDIIKSRILNLLGKSENKIYARNTIIKEISYEEEYLFLETNHIQGHTKSSIKVGLFYNDKLVSVMSFGKVNLSRGIKNKDIIELLRFASLKNYNIVGAASKLFQYFIRKYNPTEVLSYSDNRWNTGNVYNNLDFRYAGETGIGYWYIDLRAGKRIHRFNLRKNKNDNQELTEYENRLLGGYLRIWDCGNSKWIWTKMV